MSRDPRVDPRAGDILVGQLPGSTSGRTTTRHVLGVYGDFVSCARRPDLRETWRNTIDRWREWACTATILHTAETP